MYALLAELRCVCVKAALASAGRMTPASFPPHRRQGFVITFLILRLLAYLSFQPVREPL